MSFRLCAMRSLWAALLLGAATNATAYAETANIEVDKEAVRAFGEITNNFSVRIGLESAGPILFQDSPDQRIEETSVFQYGGRVAVLLGSEGKDTHRVGLGVGYNFVAKSESRKLNFTDIYAMYETGHPLVLQLHGGYSVAGGTTELAQDHGGIYSAAALRYSFDSPSDPSRIRVSPGLIGKSYLNTGDARNSSFFIGAQIEFTYNSNK